MRRAFVEDVMTKHVPEHVYARVGRRVERLFASIEARRRGFHGKHDD
jgi:hypothetical protein